MFGRCDSTGRHLLRRPTGQLYHTAHVAFVDQYITGARLIAAGSRRQIVQCLPKLRNNSYQQQNRALQLCFDVPDRRTFGSVTRSSKPRRSQGASLGERSPTESPENEPDPFEGRWLHGEVANRGIDRTTDDGISPQDKSTDAVSAEQSQSASAQEVIGPWQTQVQTEAAFNNAFFPIDRQEMFNKSEGFCQRGSQPVDPRTLPFAGRSTLQAGRYGLLQREQSNLLHQPELVSRHTAEIQDEASTRRKVDLSYVNLRKREAASSTSFTTDASWTGAFRSNAGLRRVLASFMTLFPAGHMDKLSNSRVDKSLTEVFNVEALQILQRNCYGPEDLLSWAWLFAGTSSTRQIARYSTLSQDCEKRNLSPLPIFIPLQLLRHERIDGNSLRILWAEITTSDTRNNSASMWDEDSAPILIIRALRHARKVDVALCRDIVSFAFKILSRKRNELKPKEAIVHGRRMTHLFNRMLTLLALPTPGKPFRSVGIQQQAQLDIVRHMHECQPSLVVNREGYRAFVQLQLRHPKTAEEQEWARVKSPSWPPWRRDQLGIEESLDYPGRHSRVMKVLQRMKESGYGPSDFENAAQVLAGWDTDSSPTIQVRRLMYARPMAWLRKVVSRRATAATEVVEHNTWAARVEATRTVREAWLCFHEYMDATREVERNRVVYNAMFQKLHARLVSQDTLPSYYPGDGREVFADPMSTRDLVYVPSEPPATEELYSQMLGEGIKPAGRLLANLLKSATSSDLVHQYIMDSSLSEIKRDVLLHAEKYTHAVITSILQQMPDYLLSSFIVALAQCNSSNISTHCFQRPSSLSGNMRSATRAPISPFAYARELLELAGTSYLPAYQALLNGIEYRSRALRRLQSDEEQISAHTITRVWHTTMIVIDLLIRQQVVLDFYVVRSVASIAQNLLTAVRRCDYAQPQSIPETIKCLSWFAMVGRPVTEYDWQQRSAFSKLRTLPATSIVSGSLPNYDDLGVLFQVFSQLQDQTAVFALLAWVCDSDRQGVFPATRPFARRLMMASIRIAVERVSASETDESAGERLIDKAVICAKDLGWATDDEVDYFAKHRNMT